MISTRNDRVIDFYWGDADITGVPSDVNYWKNVDGEIVFAADNDGGYIAIGQGSLGINMDHSTGYWYFIDSNPGATSGQTGHWEEA